MRLGSLKEGGRDGTLVVVSSDMSRAAAAEGVARTLQAALDDWPAVEPRLRDLAGRLENGAADAFALDPAALASPLPRAYQWLDGSAYVNHVELVRKARGVELPASFWTDPLMYQGGSDRFLAPTDAILALCDWMRALTNRLGSDPNADEPDTATVRATLVAHKDAPPMSAPPAAAANGASALPKTKPSSAVAPRGATSGATSGATV